MLDDTPIVDETTVRRCLKCHESFPSAWAGHRVCAKCKGGSTWRSGLSYGNAGSRRITAKRHA